MVLKCASCTDEECGWFGIVLSVQMGFVVGSCLNQLSTCS
jgi:hypothetical protein